MDYSSAFVCVMGMGTVFFGLVCLIGLTKLMSVICGKGKTARKKSPAAFSAGERLIRRHCAPREKTLRRILQIALA